MRTDLLNAARATASLMGTRIHLALPAILAEGETFTARLSVTGADALPLDATQLTLYLDGSNGIAGLPPVFTFDAGKSTGEIGGLRAIGPDVALIQARVGHSDGKAVISSNPAWVFANPSYRLFFGDLHVHTSYSNCHAWRCLAPEWCYEYARDIALLDFVAPADHLRGIASDPERWPRLQQLAAHYNSPGRFVSFLAFESSHAQGFGGDNNAYFLDDDAPYFWVDRQDMRGIAPKVHLKDLWKQLDQFGKHYFTVPHHTGRSNKYRSWDEDYHDPSREPLFEIYSSWGSSEARHTRLPMSGGNNDAPSYFADALKAGGRFGVIASSDDHATLPGSVHHHRTEPYRIPSLNGFAHKGLAAIRAPALSRGALFDAMLRRDTYATTHARSLVDMRIGDATMGQAIQADQSLLARREVRIRFTLDGATSARVFLMRNGEPLDAKSVRGSELMTSATEVVFTDPEDFETVAVRGAKYQRSPFVVYHARIEDENGSHQWTSPIWIDVK
jgi:hypothetical protein